MWRLTIVSFITESINATESKYKQIQTTDDDVSITEVCQIKLSRFKTTYDYHYNHHMEIETILSGTLFFLVVQGRGSELLVFTNHHQMLKDWK